MLAIERVHHLPEYWGPYGRKSLGTHEHPMSGQKMARSVLQSCVLLSSGEETPQMNVMTFELKMAQAKANIWP